MKHRLCLFTVLIIITVFLSGCVSLQKNAPKDKIAAMHKLAVIPMEPPPLTLDPLYAGSLDLTGLSTILTLAMIPDKATQTAGKSGALIFGIFMLVELPEAAKRTAKVTKTLEGLLSSEGAWIPTKVLAQEVARQISATGVVEVTEINKLNMIPGLTDRDITFFMQNWQGPIRQWYNSETSPFDYKELKAQGIDGIVEVGLLSYGIMSREGEFGIHIFMKLVDPSSGQVLGRSRDWISLGEKVKKPFEDNGANLKATFAATSSKLVNNILKDIGLVSK